MNPACPDVECSFVKPLRRRAHSRAACFCQGSLPAAVPSIRPRLDSSQGFRTLVFHCLVTGEYCSVPGTTHCPALPALLDDIAPFVPLVLARPLCGAPSGSVHFTTRSPSQPGRSRHHCVGTAARQATARGLTNNEGCIIGPRAQLGHLHAEEVLRDLSEVLSGRAWPQQDRHMSPQSVPGSAGALVFGSKLPSDLGCSTISLLLFIFFFEPCS